MSQLLLVRHAIAMDRDEADVAGVNDEDRPLTADGEKKMKRVAAGLRAWVPDVALIAASPLRRAMQTADILASAYPDAAILRTEYLRPGGDRALLLAWTGERAGAAPLALVGHEPDMGILGSWLLAAAERPFLAFKKGGAALIEFPDMPAAGRGRLLWLLTPAQLRGGC